MHPTEAMIRHLYQTDLSSFIRLVFSLLHPHQPYHHHWLVDVLAHHLQRCHEGGCKRLIINLPPRYLKSLCASVAFPAWVLGRQPEAKIMCVTGHRGLADDQHAMTRSLMTHPKYRALFPHVRLQESTRCLRLRQGGLRSAFTATPGGGITGRGADLILIDDPLAASEAEDERAVDRVNRWYDQNIYQRLDDKDQGVIVVVMQRLHANDLTGHLLQRGDWEHVTLPAIATTDERYPAVHGNRAVRRAGEALHPQLETREQLREAMLRMGAKAFMAQYQQNPYRSGEGNGWNGALTVLCDEDHADRSWTDGKLVLGNVSEEQVLLHRLFGEPLGIRPGAPAMNISTEEWVKRHGGQVGEAVS